MDKSFGQQTACNIKILHVGQSITMGFFDENVVTFRQLCARFVSERNEAFFLPLSRTLGVFVIQSSERGETRQTGLRISEWSCPKRALKGFSDI